MKKSLHDTIVELYLRFTIRARLNYKHEWSSKDIDNLLFELENLKQTYEVIRKEEE